MKTYFVLLCIFVASVSGALAQTENSIERSSSVGANINEQLLYRGTDATIGARGIPRTERSKPASEVRADLERAKQMRAEASAEERKAGVARSQAASTKKALSSTIQKKEGERLKALSAPASAPEALTESAQKTMNAQKSQANLRAFALQDAEVQKLTKQQAIHLKEQQRHEQQARAKRADASALEQNARKSGGDFSYGMPPRTGR